MFKSRRLYVSVFIFGTALFLPMVPWYVPFLAAAWASWHFMYYEFLILGLLMDLMFDSFLFFSFFGRQFPYPFLLASMIILAGLQLIKRRVRFYS